MKKMLTPFGEKIDRNCPLSEYPRPQLKRDSYLCLNGEWDYAILPKEEQLKSYQGKILVPFSPESVLSGVERTVTDKDKLYYRRYFELKEEFIKGRVLLNFGAVDYICQVSINGKFIGENRGGYYPFTFDITNLIKIGKNEITVTVTDPTEKGVQARGKQTFKRGGIWYTPQSGIWQTVWLESVPESYIKSIKLTPNIDKDILSVEISYNKDITKAKITIYDNQKEIIKTDITGNKADIKLKDYKLWSPENPYLYSLKIEAGEDTVESYFGMRKFSMGKDEKGIPRLMLNNKPYFHNGILDQGYWSDGMYTAPSDEALIYDITLMKEMGFNMLRKHIKIEPLRWYYHCDRLGMLVWQDMINGGGKYNMFTIAIAPFIGIKLKDNKYRLFACQDKEWREEYYKDSKRMVEALYNCVSIAMWVPFNEAWGQFDSKKAYDFYKELDQTRTIDHASGWHDQGMGDVKSVHIYFRPITMKRDDRPFVLSEFGGYSLKTKGHMYNENKFFGYRKYYDKESYQKAFIKLYENQILPLISKGLCATVYTELSDVEDECNGIVTYDRKIVKFDKDAVKSLNQKLKL
ncbi:MAG: glycoside hydrolase family 2 TIM barrel-domain containing protein [Bacillota bacterium]|jgi:beta-galactosidase/beta-glucuronidase|nr:glycoside hydrolase family 2 TIM barrel-domain containing protein [Bacillota bacterium]